jgi:hypothetical protein
MWRKEGKIPYKIKRINIQINIYILLLQDLNWYI